MTINSNRSMLYATESLVKWMRVIRRYLHTYPEISYQEVETAEYIQKKLQELNIPFKAGVGGTGVIATLGSKGESGACVGLRADMDALSIAEETGLPFASQNRGVMHACGHDGHVAMLLGAAALLKQRTVNGCVKLIFQPAEERGNGAEKVVKAGMIDDIQAVFAGHIDTHFPTGTLTIDEGLICAYADPFVIHVRGKSGHAARPHEATDTIVAASGLVTALQSLVSREVDPNRAAVVTVATFQSGTAHNIIAQEAVLEGTVRTTHKETRQKTIAGLERIVSSIATMYCVETVLSFNDGLPAVINSPEATEVAVLAAKKLTNVMSVISQGFPSLGAEDFSFYQQKTEGCMIRFGASLGGDVGPAHSGTFDFDESVLGVGASWLAEVACQWLDRKA
jgi:amidohydrolase